MSSNGNLFVLTVIIFSNKKCNLSKKFKVPRCTFKNKDNYKIDLKFCYRKNNKESLKCQLLGGFIPCKYRLDQFQICMYLSL